MRFRVIRRLCRGKFELGVYADGQTCQVFAEIPDVVGDAVSFEVWSASGGLVLRRNVAGVGRSSVDVEFLGQGLYVWRVVVHGRIFWGKLLVW